ncbi:MAG: TonB-dependent receptor [Sulfuritalea sp.]|nr:TonB-dependent receptor [Sulfuritalea sp.]
MSRHPTPQAARRSPSPRFTLRPTAVAVHLLLAGVVVGGWVGAAQAQTAAAASARSYNIPAGPLNAVLTRFLGESGVLLSGSTDLAQGKQSPGVRGNLPPDAALAALLAGTGLQAVADAQGRYTLRPAPPVVDRGGEAQLATVTVTAPAVFGVTQNLAAKVKAGALGDVTQKDTPFSSAVVTNEQIQEQASQKLGDLFIQDASVSDNSGTYTAWATFLTVRGMDLDWQNSYRIDGKPFLGYTVTLPYEHLEQVELLKGATGFMYGFGAPGGMLNYVTKKPTATPLRSARLGYGSSSIVRANADLGGRLGEDGALGYRFDITHEEGRAANDGPLKRSSFLLALDAKLSDRLSWDFQTIYQDRLTEDTEPTITTWSLGNRLPGSIRNDKKLVGPGNYVDNQFGFVATGLKYRLDDDWQAQTNFSQSYSKTRRNESVLNLQNAAGDYINDRSDYGERYRYSYWDAMLQGRIGIAQMTHNVVLGVSWQKQMNDDSRNWVYIPALGTGKLGSQNTIRYDSVGSFDSLGLYRSTEVTQKAIFASDRIEINERWSVLGGLRWTQYEKLSWNGAGAANTPYKESGIVTPTAALMYKVTNDTMAYASYVESLQQGAIVSTLPIYTNAGEMLNPLTSKQWELGVKKDSARWSGTAALFRVAKTTEYDRSCGTACLTKVQGGESVFQGLELGATARLSNLWSLGGNLMVLDTEYASGDAAIVGKRVTGSPRLVATAQLAYRVPEISGLQLRLGAKYTGKTPLRTDNTVDVDGYTLVSLGASYDTLVGGRPMTFRANVNNLLDKKYWMYQYANYIKAGDPRTINLSATLHF